MHGITLSKALFWTLILLIWKLETLRCEIPEGCPASMTVMEGEQIEMSCTYKPEGNRCIKTAANWNKDGRTDDSLPELSGDKDEMGWRKERAEIYDDATYQCCYELDAPKVYYTCCCPSNNLTVATPLTHMTLKVDGNPVSGKYWVREKEQVELQCEVSRARPKPQLMWKYNNEPMRNTDSLHTTYGKLHTVTSAIKVKNVQYGNDGDKYTCTASYPRIQDIDKGTKSIEFDVLYSPKFSRGARKFNFETSFPDKLNVRIPFQSNPLIETSEVKILIIQPEEEKKWGIEPKVIVKKGKRQEVYLKISVSDENRINGLENGQLLIALNISGVLKNVTIKGNKQLYIPNYTPPPEEETGDDEGNDWTIIIVSSVASLVVVVLLILVVVLWRKYKGRESARQQGERSMRNLEASELNPRVANQENNSYARPSGSRHHPQIQNMDEEHVYDDPAELGFQSHYVNR